MRIGEDSYGPDRPPTPWSVEDLLRWLLLFGAGAVMCVVGWYLSAGDTRFGSQIGPLDLAVSGTVLASIGHSVWLLRGRRTIGERRLRLLGDAEGRRLLSSSDRESPVDLSDETEVLVAGDGMSHFHREYCSMAAGRAWSRAAREVFVAAGKTPCGVCRP